MKKISLLLVSLFIAFSMSAQESKGSGAYAKSKIGENWYVTLSGGATMYFGDNDEKIEKFTNRLGWTPQFSIGKWVTPVYGFRLSAGVGTTKHYNDGTTRASHRDLSANPIPYRNAGNVGDIYGLSYFNTNLKLTYNLTNALFSYKPDRFYNMIPYVGLGVKWGHSDSWQYERNRTVTIMGGITNDFRICSFAKIFVELEAQVLQENMDYKSTVGPEWDFMGIAAVGLKVPLGKSDFTEVEPMDYGLVNDLNDQINRLRADIVILAKRPESCPECPEIQEVVANVYIPNIVFFRLDSYKIDKNQEINIYNTAEYLKANPSSKVKIVAYADRKTGNPNYNFKLSEKRAKVVAKALTSKYGIDESRISIDWKGDVEQPYAENSWNRVAIFFAD